jgi:hypothetical protein
MDHRQVVNLFYSEGVSQFLGNWANQGESGGVPPCPPVLSQNLGRTRTKKRPAWQTGRCW